MSRSADPVTSGVPLPREAGVCDPRFLRILNSAGEVLPAQFRVLARWGELADETAPIRWVLADFQATVEGTPSAAGAPNGGKPRVESEASTTAMPAGEGTGGTASPSARYSLVVDDNASPAAAGLRIAEHDAAIGIDTGRVVFSVSKSRFNLLDSVTLGGRTIVPPGHAGGLIATGLDGTIYSSANLAPRQCLVEEAGPLRYVIHVRGEFASGRGSLWMGGNTESDLRARPATAEQLAEYKRLHAIYAEDPAFQRLYHQRGIDPSSGDPRWFCWMLDTDPKKHLRPISYTVRITAWHNRPEVGIQITIENSGDALRYFVGHDALGLNDVEFASLTADLPLAAAPQRAMFESTPANAHGRVTLYQGHTTRNRKNESSNFDYSIARDGQPLTRGERARGAAAVTTPAGGVALAFDAFWEDFPKSIEMEGQTLRAGLFPRYDEPDEWDLSRHVFADGWHKTHSILLSFGEPDSPLDLSARFRSPLFAIADPPTWYAQTAVWGPIAPAGDIHTGDPALDEAIAQYERERLTMVDPAASSDGQDLAGLREHIAGHYGWQYFGGMLKYPDKSQCSVLHYDWPLSAFLHFVRTGDRRFFDEGLRFTRHSIDLDQCHFANDPYHDGMWRWESTGTHYPGDRPFHINHAAQYGAAQTYTHTWSGGYALGYLLTGDQRYREALTRTLSGSRYYWWHYMNLQSGGQSRNDQTRSQGWTILHHLYEYRITGQQRWLDDAYRLFSHSLLPTEHNRLGCWPSFDNGQVYQTFHLYPIESLVELHYEAARAGMDVAELTDFLVRWCRYTSERFFTPGRTLPDGTYQRWRNEYGLHPSQDVDPDKADLCNFVVFAVSALAYTARVIRDGDPATADRFDKVAREMFRDRYLYGPDTAERAIFAKTPAEARSLRNIPGRPLDYRYQPRFVYLLSQHEKEQGWAFRASQPFLWTLWKSGKPAPGARVPSPAVSRGDSTHAE